MKIFTYDQWWLVRTWFYGSVQLYIALFRLDDFCLNGDYRIIFIGDRKPWNTCHLFLLIFYRLHTEMYTQGYIVGNYTLRPLSWRLFIPLHPTGICIIKKPLPWSDIFHPCYVLCPAESCQFYKCCYWRLFKQLGII